MCKYCNFHIYRYDKQCYPFQNSTAVNAEFVKVECSRNNKVIYKDYYVFLPRKPLVEERCKQALSKDKFLDDRLSILVLGIDSVSRMNFHRMMPKTVKLLHSLGAVEMLVTPKSPTIRIRISSRYWAVWIRTSCENYVGRPLRKPSTNVRYCGRISALLVIARYSARMHIPWPHLIIWNQDFEMNRRIIILDHISSALRETSAIPASWTPIFVSVPERHSTAYWITVEKWWQNSPRSFISPLFGRPVSLTTILRIRS